MKKVLVVDDSGVVRLQIKQMLKGHCTVYEAANGKQVLHNTFFPGLSVADMNLLLVDLHMGEVDGYEILNFITSRYPGLPIVVISSERKKESILKCIELGAKDYILKPFNKETLIGRIRNFVDLHTSSPVSQNADSIELDSLNNLLIVEVDRAIRSKTALTVAFFKTKINGQGQYLTQLKTKIGKTLRRIDTVLVYKSVILLVLPLTNREGFEFVKNKISTNISNDSYEGLFDLLFYFPDDVNNKSLIEGYQSTEIKDLIMKNLDGIT